MCLHIGMINGESNRAFKMIQQHLKSPVHDVFWNAFKFIISEIATEKKDLIQHPCFLFNWLKNKGMHTCQLWKEKITEILLTTFSGSV